MQRVEFARYISIGFLAARTSPRSFAALRVFLATPAHEPVEVHPRRGTFRHWTPATVADWLIERLTTSIPTLVGIDYGFSLPIGYFVSSRLTGNWDEFLEEFSFQSPRGRFLMPSDLAFCREAAHRDSRLPNSLWNRLTEIRAGARSPLHSPAGSPLWESTCAGIRWLADFRRRVSPKVLCWPFDGWTVIEGRSVIVETYPALWMEHYPARGRNPHQHAAYVSAAWMRQADANGSLWPYFHPELSEAERSQAKVEGWMLGVK